MAHLLVRHKVADFGKWKPEFEKHRSARAAAGVKDLHVWRNANDADDVVLLFEVADAAKARTFMSSADLKEKMQAAGVQGPPEAVFLEED